MRRALLVLVLLLLPAYLFGQTPHDSTAAGSSAHGNVNDAHKTADAHGDAGGEHEAPKTYFGVPGWLLKLVNMLLFLAVLAYFIGGPVKASIAARGEAIKRDAEEARERRAKADRLASDIQARLTQIENDVREIHERAQAEGERQKRELIAAAEAEAQKILANARNEVENRLKHARHELTEYAGELATQRAEQILRDTINDQDRHKLFEESVREVGEVGQVDQISVISDQGIRVVSDLDHRSLITDQTTERGSR